MPRAAAERQGARQRAPPCAPWPSRTRPQGSRVWTATRSCIAAAIAAAIAAVATVAAFLTPTTTTSTLRTTYGDQVHFAYHATPRPGAGPVYPGGALSTGDPVFLKLVDRVSVSAGYRFQSDAPHRLAGKLDVRLRITAPTGWSRELPLAPATPFDGDRADGEVTLDLARIRRLTRQVERLTGMAAGGSYSLAVIARVQAAGTVSGQPITRDIAPAAAFQLDALQLRPAEPAKAAAPKADGVDVPHTVANTFGFRGHALSVAAARRLAVAGLLLALLAALISRLARFRRPVDASSRVRARYGHLLVPIAAVAPHPGRTPIDVTTIDALVALAERGERLILHHHGVERDTYLVEDGVALYRFRVERDHGVPAPRVLAA